VSPPSLAPVPSAPVPMASVSLTPVSLAPLSLAVCDSVTMLRRDLRHARRFPMLPASGILVPVIFLLLFAGVFGRTLSAGLGVRSGGYIDYLAPGILVMTVGFAAESTALTVCTDLRLGIIDRFRTMAIAPGSVLTGQVAGSLIRTMLSGVLVVAVALALGFGSPASPLEWIAAAGMFAALAVALTWLTRAGHGRLRRLTVLSWDRTSRAGRLGETAGPHHRPARPPGSGSASSAANFSRPRAARRPDISRRAGVTRGG
jgi:ABC-2 type transporter